MRFVWDKLKAAANLAKHSVAFADASMVFEDPLHRSRQDRHEGFEERWQTLGEVGGALLLVAHTWRDDDGADVIRIISARRATRQERRDYERGR